MKAHGLFPILAARDLDETVRFYEEKLGFTCRGYYPSEENRCYANLWNGATELSFNIGNEESSRNGTGMTGLLYIYVEEIEALWEKLKDTVSVDFPLCDQAYGMREFGIRDPNGYSLIFGQDMSK